MKTEKEKAKDVLKARDRARKGFAETNDEGKDPLKKQEKREGRSRMPDLSSALE